MTLEQARKSFDPPRPRSTQSNPVTYTNVDSSINLDTIAYQGNFDTNFNFLVPFYIDRNVAKVLEVTLSLRFQKFRGDTKPLPHTHQVVIASHVHTVSLGDHTHSVSIGDHSHTVSISAHSHTVPGGSHSHTWSLTTTEIASSAGYLTAYVLNSGSGGLYTIGSTGAIGGVSTSSTTPPSTTSSSGGAQTPTSSSGGGTTVSSAGGGGTTLSSNAGGGITATSEAAAGAEFGIYEDVYPVDVHVILNGVDITAEVGGPFNPVLGNDFFPDIDLTGYFVRADGGTFMLELESTGRGRSVALLSIKSIIGK